MSYLFCILGGREHAIQQKGKGSAVAAGGANNANAGTAAAATVPPANRHPSTGFISARAFFRFGTRLVISERVYGSDPGWGRVAC